VNNTEKTFVISGNRFVILGRK